jgi:hypothetical protein
MKKLLEKKQVPVFEFQCANNHRHEKRQLSFDPPNTDKCPVCGLQARRIISVCNNTFGWTYTEASYIRGNPMEFERNV